MAEQQFKISIQTAAPTGPVDALERSMRNLSRETDRLNALGTPEAARVSEFAFYDLDAQIAKTTNTAAELPEQLNRVGRGGRDNATALLMFSQAAEDAQYGIRGILNNIPGLVMALGGGMGLAGAVSIAAVGISQLISLMGRTKEEAKDSAIDVQTAADAYANAVVGALEKVDKARRQRMSIESAGDDNGDAGLDAENKAATAREDSIEALIQATKTLNSLLDRQVVAQEALAAAEAQREAQRVAAMDAAIKAEQQKASEAEKAAAAGDRALQAEMLSKAETERAAENARQKVEALRAQRDEYQRILDLEKKAGAGQLTGSVQERSGQMLEILQKADEARANQPGVEASLQAAEAAWNSLTERAKEAADAVTSAQTAALEAGEELKSISEATAQNIKTVMEQGAVQAQTDAVAAAVDADAVMAGQIKETLAIVQGSGEQLTEMQKGAVTSLQKIIDDGTITQKETLAAITAMQQLGSMLVGDVSRLATVIQSFVNLAQANQRRIEQLERQMPQTVIPGNVR